MQFACQRTLTSRIHDTKLLLKHPKESLAPQRPLLLPDEIIQWVPKASAVSPKLWKRIQGPSNSLFVVLIKDNWKPLKDDRNLLEDSLIHCGPQNLDKDPFEIWWNPQDQLKLFHTPLKALKYLFGFNLDVEISLRCRESPSKTTGSPSRMWESL